MLDAIGLRAAVALAHAWQPAGAPSRPVKQLQIEVGRVEPLGVQCEVQCEVMEANTMPKFSLALVDEIHLHRAPLAKVLMQVQYSRTPHLVSEVAENAMAEALGRYPVRRRQMIAGNFPAVVINGQPVQLPAAPTLATVFLFSDPGGIWQVTVTEEAVSLETTDYSSRDDFCDRSLEVFAAVAAVALPPVVDRVGLRYIDRLAGEGLSRVGSYIIPELRVLCDAVDRPLQVHHSVSESLIEISENERLQVRSGLVPPGGGFDPALPGVPEPSWLLDMDVFTTQGGFPFDSQELADRLRRYAETAYAFFRYATTPVFHDDHSAEAAPATRDAT